MKTEFVKITDNFDELKKAGEIIKNGGLVAFPTETVYGIGANGLNETAAQKIYEAKGRPSDNPLILHVLDVKHAEDIGYINETAKKLFDAFSPGPLCSQPLRLSQNVVSERVSGKYGVLKVVVYQFGR